MSSHIETSIVRVLMSDTVVGIGFLFTDRMLMTCCHTVNVALGHPKDQRSRPEVLVTIDFPFISLQDRYFARVTHWYPKDGDTGDIAILEITDAPPSKAKSTRLIKSTNYKGHRFSVYGCNRQFQESGRWVEGELQRLLPNGRLQAIGTSNLGYFVEPGFSGSPVWDENLQGVIGFVVSVDRYEDKLQTSIIPNNTIVEFYDELPLFGPVAIVFSEADGTQLAKHLHASLLEVDIDSTLVKDDEDLVQGSVMLVVLTPGAVESEQVERKWNYGLDKYMHIIPVLAKDCIPPGVLSILDLIDFSKDAHYDHSFSHLVRRIHNPDFDYRHSRHEMLTGRQDVPSPKYPVVVGQRLITTIEYFQDRVEQMREIGEVLSTPSTRLISVTGTGGIGKTALVSKLLFDLERNTWPHTSSGKDIDGILYLSNRNVNITIERLFLDCAELLGGEEKKELNNIWTDIKASRFEKISRLLEVINKKVYIILLDNIEDLLDQSGNLVDEDLDLFFRMSLSTPGEARIIITSREPISFDFRDAPLDKHVVLTKGLDTHYGVAMLRQADPSGLYGLRDADEQDLAKVVEMVHGLPRALEVFAGIVKDEKNALLTLDEIMERFFEHPMTEKELVQEGYRRLDGNAKKVIQGMAVFGRPIPINAVSYLLTPFIPDADITGIVLRLIRIHMITVVDKKKKLVALHPMDRDFAYTQIPRTASEIMK